MCEMGEESAYGNNGVFDEEQVMEEPFTENNKRRKFHFSVNLDNQLLRTTIAENPFQCAVKERIASWTNVAAALDEQFVTEQGLLPRTVRDRCERLLSYFEQGHPLLQTNNSNGQFAERLDLLDQLSKLRKESYARLVEEQPPVAPRKTIRRLNILRTPVNGDHTRNSSSSVLNPDPLYSHVSTPLPENDSFDGRMGSSIGNGLPAHNSDNSSGIYGQSSASGPNNLRIVSDVDGTNFVTQKEQQSLGAEERSLVKDLLEARRMEDNRRHEEFAIRREELQVQKMKLELEKMQWEADRKERETRLALEEQERRIVLEFMRKTLLTPTTNT